MAHMRESRVEYAPSSSTEIMPTIPVLSLESVFPGVDPDIAVASPSAGLGASCKCGRDAECPADVHVALLSRSGSSREVRSWGTCRLDGFDDTLSSGVNSGVAMDNDKTGI